MTVLLEKGELEEALETNKKSNEHSYENSYYLYSNAEIYYRMNDKKKHQLIK